MNEIVIVGAARTAIGRRGGSLSQLHAADLLAAVLPEVLRRAGTDPGDVSQVVGGCVQQVGMQSGNVTRTAWLTAGLPLAVPASTVNAQCGSGQQATTLVHGLLAGGLADVGVACGVENMSALPFGSTLPRDPDTGPRYSEAYAGHFEETTQFEGSDRIAATFGVGRTEIDALGVSSQERAAHAWEEGWFDEQVVPVGLPDGATVTRDECLRATSMEALAGLRVNRGDAPDAVHTAGTSSQIADGAAAVVLATAARAEALGLRARARVVDSVLVGSDPELMLTGPIPATEALLNRNGLAIDDLDVIEVNEAFASVVHAWAKAVGVDVARANPNGGAIALGHPLGASGPILITKALHELERTGGRYGLVTMCCGGGLGTGTLIERI